MIKYRNYQPEDKEQLRSMIKCLYSEDSECTAMTDQKINQTIEYLSDHKDMGSIIIFEDNHVITGYAILINFWSNEYGGFVVHIDELYVKEVSRNRSIATGFINHLLSTGYNNAVALFLEVTPSNDNAYRLYQRNGFREEGRRFMLRRL